MTQRVQTVKKLKDSLENYLSLSGTYTQARNTYYLWVYVTSKKHITDMDIAAITKDVLAGYEDVFSQNLLASTYYSQQDLSITQLHNLTYYKFIWEAEEQIYNIFHYGYGLEELVNFDIAEFIFNKVLDSPSPALAAYTVLHLVNAGTVLPKNIKRLRQMHLYYIKKKKGIINHED